jgi:hypothetical protein
LPDAAVAIVEDDDDLGARLGERQRGLFGLRRAAVQRHRADVRVGPDRPSPSAIAFHVYGHQAAVMLDGRHTWIVRLGSPGLHRLGQDPDTA